MTKIPQFVRQFLWDIDQKQLSATNHQQFIIERVLEYGDQQAFNWLKQNYNKEQIGQVLKTSRRISAKTGNFYALIYQLDKKELLCLQQPYTQKQNRF